MELNLDRTERKHFTTHLVDAILDGRIAPDRDECWDSLVRKFGERYGFEDSDLNSEFESILDEAIDESCRVKRPHSSHLGEDLSGIELIFPE